MSGKAITPPKGRATRARNEDGRGAIVPPKVQWALAIIGALIVLGVILYLGRDVRSDLNGAPIVASGIADVVVAFALPER